MTVCNRRSDHESHSAARVSQTPFTETEALLLAIEDAEVDSGNHGPLDRYIVENLTPRERRKLSTAASLLEERCWKLRDSLIEEVDLDA